MADVTSVNQIVITATDDTGTAFSSVKQGVAGVSNAIDPLKQQMVALQQSTVAFAQANKAAFGDDAAIQAAVAANEQWIQSQRMVVLAMSNTRETMLQLEGETRNLTASQKEALDEIIAASEAIKAQDGISRLIDRYEKLGAAMRVLSNDKAALEQARDTGFVQSEEQAVRLTKAIAEAGAQSDVLRQKMVDADQAAAIAVQSLVASYDPLGTKLRELQNDLATLNAAVASGSLKGSDPEVERAYARINAEIEKTSALMSGANQKAEAELAALVASYDPLGAKLAKLQGDLATLNQAVASGALNADDPGVVRAFARINDEIAKTGALLTQTNQEAATQVQALVAKYDPLGTKLRELEGDVETLNKAIAAGGIKADDPAVVRSFERLNAEIAKTKQLLADTSNVAGAEVQRLVARYDPLGTKLKQLQADVEKLNQAITSGAVSSNDPAAVRALKNLGDQIAVTKQQISGIGPAAEASLGQATGHAVKLNFATSGVTREFIVLGHEAMQGQFSRIPGSLVVMLERLGSLHALLTLSTLAWGAAAAVIGIFILAIGRGHNEVLEMNAALFKTGGFADMTRGQMLALANQIADTGKITVGAAKELVTTLVSAGKLGGSALAEVAKLAADYAKATHEDISKVGPELAKLFADPAKAAQELINGIGGLTVAEAEHIRHLQQRGQLEEAQLLLADRMKAKIPDLTANLGALEKAWQGVRNWASSAWDAMLNVGRPKTPEQALAEAQALVDRLQAGQSKGGISPGYSASPTVASTSSLTDAKEALRIAQEEVKAKADSALFGQLGAQAEAERTKAERESLAVQQLINSGQRGQIDNLNDENERIKASAQYRAGDAAALDKVRQNEKEIASIYRSMDAERRAAVEGQIGQAFDLADAWIKGALEANDAELKLGKTTQVLHDQNETALLLERNLQKQIVEEKLLGISTISAKERADHERKLADLKAEATNIAAKGDDKVLQDMKDLDDIVAKISGTLPTFAENFQRYQKALADEFALGKISLEEYARLTNMLLDQQPFAVRWRDAEAAIARANGEYQKFLNKMQDGIEKQEEAIKLLGASPDAIARATKELEVQQKIDAEILNLWVQYNAQISKGTAEANNAASSILTNINDIYSRQGLLVSQAGDLAVAWSRAKRELDDWKSILSSLADRGAAFIEDFVQHGSSAFKNLWQDFLKWALAALAKIAAQKIVLAIATSIGGTAAAAANTLFGSGGSQVIPGASVLNQAPTLLGLPSFSTAVENLGTILPTFSASMEAGAGIFESASAAFAGTAASFATIGIPLLGLAIPLVAGLLGHKGGPKEGGSASNIPGYGSFFPGEETSAGNAAATAVLQSTQASYDRILAAIGGHGTGGFAIGFDSDPKGSAGNRVSAGAFVDGQSVYQHRDVPAGTDDASLQAALQLEAERAVLAALKASDLPAGVAALFNTVDVASATHEQIAAIESLAATYRSISETLQANLTAAFDGTQATADKLIAFAGIAVSFGDSIGGLGAKLEALDPANITKFIDALGGAQAAVNAFAYLNANFTTSAQRAVVAQGNLTKAWDTAGVTVDDLARAGLTTFPQTHEQFLQLFHSLDLNTEHGQALAATLLNNVAPAFVAVQGTADAAAAALLQQAQAGRDYFNQHFLSPAEQLAQRQTVDSTAIFEATRQTTELGRALHALGVDELPLTRTGIVSLRAQLVGLYGEGSAIVNQFDAVIPSVGDLIDSVGGLGNAAEDAAKQTDLLTQSVGSIIKVSTDAAAKLLANYAGIAATSTGDFGSKLALQIGLIQGAIDSADRADFSSSTAFNAYVGKLRAGATDLTTELARYTILTAQYDAARAEQLVALERDYADQKKLFGGNFAVGSPYRDQAALDALAVTFQQRWDAIVNGAAAAATSLDDFIKSIENIANNTGGNAGQKARLELALSDAKLTQMQVQYAAALPGSALATALATDIAKLKVYNTGLQTQIDHFATYSAQYGADVANQLIALETQFEATKLAIGDNAAALAVATEIFTDQFQKIIDGVSAGVGALEKLKQGIREFIDSLRVSDLSPLSGEQKLQEAAAQFNQQYAGLQAAIASGGDVSKYDNITQYADTYLKIARDAYASGAPYLNIFNDVEDRLAAISDYVQAPGSPSTSQEALVAALPTNSKLASSADVHELIDALRTENADLRETVTELITALADAGSKDTAALVTATTSAAQQQAALAESR